jgi:hypothetical protein
LGTGRRAESANLNACILFHYGGVQRQLPPSFYFEFSDKPTKNTAHSKPKIYGTISPTLRGKSTQAGSYVLIKRILGDETFGLVYIRPSYYIYSAASVITGKSEMLFRLILILYVDRSCTF